LPNRALAKPGTNDGTIVAEPKAYKEVVFYASSPITLEWDKASRSYVASENFTGAIRTAAVNDVPMADWNNQTKLRIPDLPAFKDRRKILDAYATTFPTKSEITLDHDGGEQATVAFNWKTERMDGQPSQGKDLLMMGFDATHMASLQNRNPVEGLVYLSNFGTMSANAGDTWTQKLSIPVILRNSPNGDNLWLGSSRIKEADREKIRPYLLRDARLMMATDPDPLKSFRKSCNDESYNCGKYLYNVARLALIARELGETGLQQELGAYLAKNLKPWFEGIDPSDPSYAGSPIKENILYDTVNNGIITQRAFKNQFDDFYNAWYVDHMFHYGYYIYASAVLATIDSNWLAQNKEKVNLLARDIANPSLEDQHFPLMRTYDWFRMQNLADAGPDANGANTESSSESINANYALALWGAVIGDSSYQALAAIMTAGEIRSAQAFYQITPDSLPLRDAEPVTVTVNLPGGKSGTQTMAPTKELVRNIIRANNSETNVFFGQRLIFRVGIQVLPINPISEYVISDKWAKTHEMQLRELEGNETSLFNDVIGRLPTANSDCFLAIYSGGDVTQRMPAEYCTGAMRVSYNWRQSIAALNGVNDAQGAYDRYLSYAGSLEEQQRKYIQMTAAAFAPQGGVIPDVLKDVSTPSTDTNTLWWLSARKSK
jgi:endoglucanase Acf2